MLALKLFPQFFFSECLEETLTAFLTSYYKTLEFLHPSKVELPKESKCIHRLILLMPFYAMDF